MRILRVYPRAWRARYGEELGVLIEELGGTARLSWSQRLDLVRAGVGERARALGLHGRPPRERARESSLLVLYAWMLFVIGGFGVEKAAEHWRAVTPAAKQALPAASFDVLLAAAGLGAAFVLVGLAASLPPLAAFLGGGGRARIQRPIIRAVLLSVLVVAATVGLGRWAHSLTAASRNGHDAAYGGAFVAWVLLLAACLFTWAAAAGATARQLCLPARTLRLEVWLAAGVTGTMVVMTVATATWWGSLAEAAPWFFDGRPAGGAGTAFPPNLIVPVALMAIATSLGLLGTVRALGALGTMRRSSAGIR